MLAKSIPICRPSDPPCFKDLMEDYVNRCTGAISIKILCILMYVLCLQRTTEISCIIADLSRKILRGIALALDGPSDMFEGNIAGDPFWVLRIIGYPTVSNSNGKQMLGAKTDIGW